MTQKGYRDAIEMRRGKCRAGKSLAFLGEDQDREHLKKLNMHKSMGLLQGTHRCQLPWKGHGGLWEVPED